jgi:hypothetical protein
MAQPNMSRDSVPQATNSFAGLTRAGAWKTPPGPRISCRFCALHAAESNQLSTGLPEQAARIAAALTLVDNFDAGEVGSGEMKGGIVLAQHYVGEAMRLFGASRVSGAHACQPAVWSAKKGREPVPVTSDAERSLPNARRTVAGRAEGQ